MLKSFVVGFIIVFFMIVSVQSAQGEITRWIREDLCTNRTHGDGRFIDEDNRMLGDFKGPLIRIGETFQTHPDDPRSVCGIMKRPGYTTREGCHFMRAHIGAASPGSGCSEMPCPEFDAENKGPFPPPVVSRGVHTNFVCDTNLVTGDVDYETFAREKCPGVHLHGASVEFKFPLERLEPSPAADWFYSSADCNQDVNGILYCTGGTDPFEHVFPGASKPWVYNGEGFPSGGPNNDCRIVVTPNGWKTWSRFSHLWNGSMGIETFGVTEVEIVIKPVNWAPSEGPIRFIWFEMDGTKHIESFPFNSNEPGFGTLRTYNFESPNGIAGILIGWGGGGTTPGSGQISWALQDVGVSDDFPDVDFDAVPDSLDNCLTKAQGNIGEPGFVDTDRDGYGNACDGDFNNDGSVTPEDFDLFVQDFITGVDSGIGTDMDNSGSVNPTDFMRYFLPVFVTGVPGPSGLHCAGGELECWGWEAW